MDCFFFFKQKTAYEMRISDWSSDVCSSDLKDVFEAIADHAAPGGGRRTNAEADEGERRFDADSGGQPQRPHDEDLGQDVRQDMSEHHAPVGVAESIGRASGRERGCQYV